MPEPWDPDEARVWELLETALDRLLDEVSFASDAPILVGDPQVIAGGHVPDDLGALPWRWVEAGVGRLLLLSGQGESEGPHVYGIATLDGPVGQVAIYNTTDVSLSDEANECIGELICPSGRLAVGPPPNLARWGAELDVEAQEAEVRSWRDEPDPRSMPIAFVARVPRQVPLPVYILRRGDRIILTSIDTRPAWVNDDLTVDLEPDS